MKIEKDTVVTMRCRIADDKGQLVMHLSALEALRTVGRGPAVNLTFVVLMIFRLYRKNLVLDAEKQDSAAGASLQEAIELAQAGGFDLPSTPIQLKRRAQFLRAGHATQRGDVFRGELGGHGLAGPANVPSSRPSPTAERSRT